MRPPTGHQQAPDGAQHRHPDGHEGVRNESALDDPRELPDLSSTHMYQRPCRVPARGCDRRPRRKRSELDILVAAGGHTVEPTHAVRAGRPLRGEETCLEHREQLHHSAGPLRVRRDQLWRRTFKMPGALAAARCQDLGRALVDSCESKSVLTFAWDVFYIGHSYGVTGPKGRPSQRRRRRRCGRRHCASGGRGGTFRGTSALRVRFI